MSSPPSYDSLLSKARDLCYTNIHGGPESGWIFHSRQKDVDIATKTVGENVWSKGTGIIPFPVEIVHYIFADREYRPKWDAMFDCGADVEKIDKDTVISYAAFKAPWPVASRDFVIIGRTTPVPPPEGPGLFIHTISIEDRRAPVKKPYVRGTIMFSGVYITTCKENPQHSNVTYVVASDPNGSLPKWLVNAAAVSQPLCIAMIRAFLQSNPAVVANVQKIIAARNAAPAQTNGHVGEPTPTPAVTTTSPSPTDAIVFAPTPYDAVLERAKADSLDAIRADGEVSGWTFHSRQQEVDIYLKRVPGSTTEQCKGIGEIAAPADVVTAIFNGDGEVRLKWDEMFEKGHVVKEYDAYTGLYYSAFKAPWPVAPRDFFIVYRNQRLPDGSLLTWSTSLTDNQLCPQAKGYVRGTLFYSGLLVTPITPNSCRVVYCLGSDPNGNIPKMIVNAANVKQPLCIAVIRDLLKKEPSLIAKVRAEEASKLQAFQNKQQTIEQKVNGTTTTSATTTTVTTTTTTTTNDKPIFAVTKYDPVLIKARAETWAGIQGGTDDGWIFHSRQKEVDIFTKTVGGNVYTKGIGIVPFPPHVCSYIFTDKTTRTHWDEMFEKGHDVERLDGYTNIAYTAFKAPWPVSSRDFVIVGRAEQLDDGSIFVFSCSCTHPREPVKKNYVRGTIHYSGMLFTPIAGTTHTRVTYLVASDPNGSLPKSLVNAAAVSQPMCIARVRDFLLKDPQLVASIPPFGSKLTAAAAETATSETGVTEEDANDVETIVPLDAEMANNELYTRFMSISHWSHFRTCISTLSRLPLAFLCPSAWSRTVPTTTKTTSSDVQVGVLSVRVIKVKPDVDRKWPNKIKENSYHCRVTHAGQTYDTTTGTEWSQDCAFPVYNPDGELQIVLMGEHTDSHKQMMLGSCSLPLMECAAPAPGMARRGWYRLETREGPAQLVLCIETSYAFSMLADLASEFRPRPPAPAPADAVIVAQYDAAALVDHAWSVIDAIEPVYAIAKQQVDVWKWTNVTTSVLILMAFIGLCFYPEWLPTGIILYLLTLLLLSCARIHFRIAAVGGDTWWKQQTLRNTRRRILIDAIRRRETQMTAQTKRQLQWLQHQFGRLAQQIESTFSVLTWRSPESSTAAVAYLIVCLILSITLSFQYLSVFVALTLFSSRSKQAGSVAWVLNRGLNHIRRRHAYHQAIRMRG